MNIVIVGGGASGLMASILLARKGHKITILEANDTFGKKLLASGNGRCNLSNKVQTADCYHSQDPAFPWLVVSSHPAREAWDFFEKLGVHLKDRNGWLYPYSDQASAVRDLLVMEARELGVKMKTRQVVLAIQTGFTVCKEDPAFFVQVEGYAYPADSVVLCCGSPASTVEGSSADGYEMAAALGHKIIKAKPALCGIRCKGNYFSKWSGVRFESKVSLYGREGLLSEEVGEVQFTDYGISGIPVFQISRYAAIGIDRGEEMVIELDFMPSMSREELISFLEERMEACPYKSPGDSLLGFLPAKVIPFLCGEVASAYELAEHIKRYPLLVKDVHSMEQAQVCCGGISTDEIDPSSMESRLHPGLYFAGELVDVDGRCGGYNLQWAWSSAMTLAERMGK